jgi:hypothetical protein
MLIGMNRSQLIALVVVMVILLVGGAFPLWVLEPWNHMNERTRQTLLRKHRDEVIAILGKPTEPRFTFFDGMYVEQWKINGDTMMVWFHPDDTVYKSGFKSPNGITFRQKIRIALGWENPP